jgi:CBS domain-containing protein
MRDRDVGCVVVVDEDDRPQGVVTDRTVALALAEMSDIADEEVMTLVADDVATGATEMNIFQIVETMSDATVRRLPIVDEDGTLAGIVTIDDITVLLSSELNSVSQILESQSPRL